MNTIAPDGHRRDGHGPPLIAEQHFTRPTEELLRDPRCLGEIPRRHAPGVDEFRAEFLEPQIPVILSGLIDDWRATREWSIDWFRSHFPDLRISVGFCCERKRLMPLGEYLDKMDELALGRPEGDHPPAFMEVSFFDEGCAQLQDYYTVPAHFDDDWFDRRWWPIDWRPRPKGVLIGPKGSFTKLHHDLLGTHTWLAHVVGCKQWLLVPPAYMDDVYMETRQAAGFFPGTSLADPDVVRYPRLANARFYVGEVRAGEVIWLPSLWLHEVHGLEETISVTHNTINGRAFIPFLRRYLASRYRGKQGV